MRLAKTLIISAFLASVALAKPPEKSGAEGIWKRGTCFVVPESRKVHYTYRSGDLTDSKNFNLDLKGEKPAAIFCSFRLTRILTESRLFTAKGALEAYDGGDFGGPSYSYLNIKPGYKGFLLTENKSILLYPDGKLVVYITNDESSVSFQYHLLSFNKNNRVKIMKVGDKKIAVFVLGSDKYYIVKPNSEDDIMPSFSKITFTPEMSFEASDGSVKVLDKGKIVTKIK